MTALAVLLTVLVAAWMAWRGYRRGAVATLLGWVPLALATWVLLLGLVLAWSAPAWFGTLCLLAALVALAVLVGGAWLVRATRRRFASGARAGDGQEKKAGTLPPRSRSWAVIANRACGALLGLVAAAFVCLAVACLGSAIPFAYSMAAAAEKGPGAVSGEASGPLSAPKWVEDLGRACSTVADITSFGLLDHIPCLGTYGREVRSLIVLLNAPRHQLARLARKHGLADLAALPEVRDALSDSRYLDLLDRVGKGDLTAIKVLAQHEATRRLLDCPQVRRLTSTLTPSELARELSAEPQPAESPDPSP